MKVLSSREEVVEVENHLEIEHEGEKYRHVAYYSEKCSGYDWYNAEGKKIDDPDWAEDLDMDDIWRSNEFAKSKATCPWCGDEYKASAWNPPHYCKEEE